MIDRASRAVGTDALSPIVDARMPARFDQLMSMGLPMLFAMAVAHLQAPTRRPRLVMALIGLALVAELDRAPQQRTGRTRQINRGQTGSA